MLKPHLSYLFFCYLLFLSLSAEAVQKDTLTVIGVGDIMMGTNFPDRSTLPPNGGADLLKEVSGILQNADVTFGNLEGVIMNEGGTAKNCRDPKTCYVFRSPESYLHHLIAAGFDMVSTANNHVNDFGLEGRQETARALTDAGIPFAGFTSQPTALFVKDSITYGLAAFAPHSGTVSMLDEANAIKIVKSLAEVADVVIVSFHAGAEGKDHQHVTRKTETYLGYSRGNVYDFSRKMIDAGADIIFGHGPHVTRAVDLYKDRFIAYSLGNFCTYRRFNLSGPNGYAPIIKVYTNTEGKFLKAEVTSVRQIAPGGPTLDSTGKAFSIIQQLTEEDIPENSLDFSNSWIFPSRK